MNPFERNKKIILFLDFIRKCEFNFDTEGRVSLTKKLLQHSKIKTRVLFVGLGKTFQIWEPTLFEKFKTKAIQKSDLNRASLKWEKKDKLINEENNDNQFKTQIKSSNLEYWF